MMIVTQNSSRVYNANENFDLNLWYFFFLNTIQEIVTAITNAYHATPLAKLSWCFDMQCIYITSSEWRIENFGKKLSFRFQKRIASL